MLEDIFGSMHTGPMAFEVSSRFARECDDSPGAIIEEVIEPSTLIYKCPGRVRDSRAATMVDPFYTNSHGLYKTKDDSVVSHGVAKRQHTRFDSLKSLNTSIVIDVFVASVTRGSQVYIHHSTSQCQYDSNQTGTLWHLTTTFATTYATRPSDARPCAQTSCFICKYPHPRRVCPLVRCRFCCQHGHLQYVCPLRRINSRMAAAKKRVNDDALTLPSQKY
jgi:hypothetical protein